MVCLSTFVGSLSLKKHQTFLKFAMTSKKKFFFIFLKYCESKIEKKKLEKEKRNFVRHNKGDFLRFSNFDMPEKENIVNQQTQNNNSFSISREQERLIMTNKYIRVCNMCNKDQFLDLYIENV